MTFNFRERRTSRKGSTATPGITLEYVATGETDQATVHAYALAMTPAVFATAAGLTYRSDVLIEPAGYAIYNVSVPYSTAKQDVGSVTLSFDTTGGTLHISASKQTVGKFVASGTAPDCKQAIGVSGPDKEPDGAEIVVPVLKLTATFKQPAGVITIAQIKNLARWTGKVNSDTFLTFAPGEVLFLGCTGQEGTDQPTEVQYHFACSENLASLTINGITATGIQGHHLYWIMYKSATDQNKGIKVPFAIYVERVYDTIPMALSFGFGG